MNFTGIPALVLILSKPEGQRPLGQRMTVHVCVGETALDCIPGILPNTSPRLFTAVAGTVPAHTCITLLSAYTRNAFCAVGPLTIYLGRRVPKLSRHQ